MYSRPLAESRAILTLLDHGKGSPSGNILTWSLYYIVIIHYNHINGINAEQRYLTSSYIT